MNWLKTWNPCVVEDHVEVVVTKIVALANTVNAAGCYVMVVDGDSDAAKQM